MRFLFWRLIWLLFAPWRLVLGWLRGRAWWPLAVRFWIVGVMAHPAGTLIRHSRRLRGTIRRRGERWLVREEFARPLRIERFVFPGSLGWRLVIRSVRVDGEEQLAGAGMPLSAEVFSEVALGVALAFPPATLLELELERTW